ncbi:hypothetical protein JANAI62_29140 [Jannaschia pagri]|uniref:Ribonuclease E n=1 Tax=Jannaschia pagri TaxID=2829797 RepID=A0ABQ4NPF3_9RHOB|nr:MULTISPECIES: ribonuclease E/G [unclassified Jannaschia]GIT92456.1 hypothetical protein JANAI61_29140 [Jannaschia sp. AI_61]GIT96291.1 hypothetical protein JANAI62_29140 [Jannaschia sp. AI_62]
MAKKMLIDATHPEETRVVVADGNKVEEFDFESLNKRQLAGNIYLAKVTRVEPSLQAAFVDYGGNRHGFLAFSEIHPDYYQIPKADRDALLAEERAYAEAMAAAEDAADAKSKGEGDEDASEAGAEGTEEEKPKKSRSRSRSRSRKKKTEEGADAPATAGETAEEAPAPGSDVENEVAVAAPDGAGDGSSAPEAEAPAEAPVSGDDVLEVVDTSESAVAELDAPDGSVQVTSEASDVSEEPAPEVETSDDAEPSSDGDETGTDDDGPVTTIAEDTGLEDETIGSGAEDTLVETPEGNALAQPETPDVALEAGTSDPVDGATDADADASETTATVDASEPVAPQTDAPQTDAPQTDVPMGMETVDLQEPDTGEETNLVEEPAPKKSRSRSRKKASEKDASVETVADDDEADEIRPPRKPRPRKYKIQEVIKVRQIMLVQVVKEERGNKGAALTTYLSLAGRYCVLMPNTARGGGISRKITNAADRKKLKEISSEIDVPQGAGLIVRTAGAKRTKTEIKRDYEYLQRQWEQVRELTLKSIAPAPIYEEGNLIHRSIRDLYSRDIDEVIVEGEAGYRQAKDYMKLIMPSHAKNVKAHAEGGQPLFAKHGVEQYLSAMFNPTVQLKSGGYIVIGITEALVAVDVNSGKSTKEGSIEDTAVKTNLEAAEEVARQAKLRDLAGLIVIDFIDMDERKNNTAVEKRLKDALKNDRARIQVGRISGFGLLEMSRQRLRPGMLEATTQECPHCHGTGLIRSDDSVALQVLRAIEEEGTKKRSREVLLKVPVGICNYIMNDKREHLASIEARYGMAVRLMADPSLVAPDFSLEKFKTATRQVPKPTAQVIAMDTSWTPEEEEDVVEAEAQEVTEVPASDPGEGGDGAPKKRRRRRSRKRKSSGEDGPQATQEATADDAPVADVSADVENGADPVKDVVDEATASETQAEAAPADATQSKGKSRSRSRSRSRKSSAAVSEETAPVTDAETQEVEPTPEPQTSAPEAEATTEVEDAPKPKRSRARAKAPAPAPEPVDAPVPEQAAANSVAEETADAPEATEDTAPAASAPETPPTTVKRPRARAKAPAPTANSVTDTVAEDAPAEAEEDPAPAPETPADPVVEVAEPEVIAEADAPKTPKRRGWWSFGG